MTCLWLINILTFRYPISLFIINDINDKIPANPAMIKPKLIGTAFQSLGNTSVDYQNKTSGGATIRWRER
jgi:hypothetical protein